MRGSAFARGLARLAARRPRGAVAVLRAGARLVLGGLAVVLVVGTFRTPHFWLTARQRGDRWMAAGEYRRAAEVYEDPWRVGTARYRDGRFEDAARAFAAVPGAVGAFDQGNAWLMHGQYDDAIASYTRALALRPGWIEAEENRALARARKRVIDDAGRDRDQESADAYDPDEVVTDPPGEDAPTPPEEMNEAAPSDAELRATWLRRVRTTPGDFLRAKFAYQAARADAGLPDGSPGDEGAGGAGGAEGNGERGAPPAADGSASDGGEGPR